jgi:DNA-binding beta-propeller fold protein YncE
MLEGDLPDPSKLVVETERGDFAQVDLEMGSIGPSLTGGSHGTAVRVMADGSIVCLCLAESLSVGDSPTVASVALNHYAADGKLASSTPIETFTGQPDPRDAGTLVPERPPHVLTTLGFSEDDRYGFVGFSFRAHPVWKSGILVIDLAGGTVVSRLQLPDEGTGDGDARRVVDAPTVVGSTTFLRLLVARSAFSWYPVASENASYSFGTDVFAASFKGGQLTGAAPLAGAADCGEVVRRGGLSPDGGTWLACSSGGSTSTIVRRLALDGSRLDDTRVAGRSGIDGDMTAVSPDGRYVFVWNPVSATLTRVDLATAETATGQGDIPAAGARGPLAAFGDWLAPTAAAKSLLRGGVVVSPDGSRVYAIGVNAEATGPEAGGSTGVFVFDAASLASVGRWDPTADFASLAVSADGQLVYAAGLSGVDATGNSNSHFSASITVFDARDGAVRLIAGQLGGEMLSFAAPILD